MSGLPDPRVRPLLGADEARHALGDPLGRSAWYEAIRAGEVPGVRHMGRRVFLSTAALLEWVGLDAPSAGDEHVGEVAPLRAVGGEPGAGP